ncbi:hypothetical protein, partial [Escherichia coli]|uniref:hypothetical protein n=1 Tax=Escherichia coli TaxID=562 RepID=UPI003A97F834
KTSIFSHPVYLFLRKFSLQDSRGGSVLYQIDVFWGHDEGITTEAVHNAIKCTVAFRRIQYTD